MSENTDAGRVSIPLQRELDKQTEEDYVLHCLDMLRRDYEKAAKPYFDRLYAIRAREMPRPMIITAEQLMALNLKLDK